MSTLTAPRLPQLDGIAIGLSGLCAIHCVATAILVGLFSSATVLLAPAIHETGLGIAMILGGLALGHGALHHGRLLPVAIGSLGLGIMAGALTLGHEGGEAVYTILGVTLLASGHVLNRRSLGHACHA